MLKSIKVSNFYSIGETQEMSFIVGKKDILDDSAVGVNEKTSLNLVSCVIGHNASGKTSILKAITFIFWWLENGYTRMNEEADIDYLPHLAKPDKTSFIEIEFYNQEILYKYSVTFNREKVLREYLGVQKQKAFTRLFQLERLENTKTISSITLNRTDAARFKNRENIPFFSCLLNTGYLPEISLFKHFNSNIDQAGFLSRLLNFHDFYYISERLYNDNSLQKDILEFAKTVDLGIDSFSFHSLEEKKAKLLFFNRVFNTTSFSVPFLAESHGSQRGLFLLMEILPILKTGGIVILDEIEKDLHPLVVKKIIALFTNPETNAHHAQLIFSTHQHLLLNDRTKTQIFIAEKNKEKFETEIYRLDEVEGVRNDEIYFHKYLAGSYGGTPDIKWI